LRDRPVTETLVAARQAAVAAGVTRLADLSGLAPLGIPICQAVRPFGRLFSVAQGKGLTPAAAKVSALLEAVETDQAERLAPEGPLRKLAELDTANRDLWHDSPRDRHGLSVDPGVPRHWAAGVDLMSGRPVAIPWDALSLDFTRALPKDVQPSSLGLASGNNRTEALVSGVAELLEHDLDCAFDARGPVGVRQCELDLDSIDDPVAKRVLRRLGRTVALRVWSVGQEARLPAFRCLLTDLDWQSPAPPVAGNGCHPDRTIALLRAVLEAAQSRCTMIAGAREDLSRAHYRNAARQTGDLLMASLSFGPGPLPWSHVADRRTDTCEQALDTLLEIAAARSSLPVVAFTHAPPHPDLAVVHCLGPGLLEADRDETGQAQPPALRPIAPSIARNRRPILFIGPTLPAEAIGPGIELRPPAECGDLAALLADPPPVVGLIDGRFECAPTVWHKEILDLIAAGVTVIGGASLGAIRAAELAPFGMIGVGAIFEAYRDGSLSRDDAVMISHAPAELGYRPLTLALVDAEAALEAVEMPAPVRRHLQRIVRTADFRDRSWSQSLAIYAERTGAPAPVDLALLEAASDRKRKDAIALVESLRTATLGKPRARPPITAHYAMLLASLHPSLRLEAP